MELEDFKSVWKADNAHALPRYATAQIEDMLRQKTHHILDKIRRSIYFEIISMVVIIAAFLAIGVFSSYQTLRIYFGSFTLLFIPYTWVFVYLLRQTNALQQQQAALQQQLKDYLLLMETFQKRYLQFCMALIPVCVVFSFLISFYTQENIPALDKIVGVGKPSLWIVLAALVLYLGLFSAGMYYFTKWYLKKLYGRYLSVLRQNLQELNSTE
ncbi:MAG: hypothetical protein EAZ62_02540 [Sphingobacteriia bacterium]|nr:MAG: hypothetical protein EAZ62_02540 [Sphingobacteriia bacterium]